MDSGKGVGQGNHIANVRQIRKRAREHHTTVYLCSIDYSKAFDTAQHLKMWNNMKSIGIPEHLTMLIRDLHTEQEAKVQAEQGTSGSLTKNEQGKLYLISWQGLIYTVCPKNNETYFFLSAMQTD